MTSVVLESTNDPIAHFAREELERYLLRAKAPLKVTARIRLGSDYACACFPREMARLKPNGFVIGRVNDEVVIGGADANGLLYGVYEYIEKALGIRWVDAPFGEVSTGLFQPNWPERTLELSPAFPYRGGNMHMSRTDDDFLHNIDRLGKFRMNNVLLFSHQLDLLARHTKEFKKRGVKVTFGGHCWPYFFYDCGKADRKEFLALYPAWHALVDGQRVACDDSLANFCLSSREAVEHFTDNIISMLEEHHDAIDIISLWPNDTGAAFCECEACRAARRSDLVLRLINHVAERVTARWPHMKVEMLAYEDFTEPPQNTHPHERVIVNFAGIARDYRMPIYGAERRNIALFSHLKGWRALCPDQDMIVYEYYRLDSIPKSTVIQHELARLRDEGLTGLMDDSFQVNNPAAVQEAVGFMTYLEAKLLWNPDQSADAMQRELTQTLFGRQTALVNRVLARMEQLQAARMHYDLLWHEWRNRPLETLRAQDMKLTYITRELTELLHMLSQAIAQSNEPVASRLVMLRESVALTARFMQGISYHLKAQILLLSGGTLEDFNALLGKALLAHELKPSEKSAEEIAPYLAAYDLGEESVRLIIPIDRKDRVGRVKIMAMRDRLCARCKEEAGGCLNCTMPVCPDMARLSPQRSFR